MACLPCYYKRQRLQAKLNATIERGIQWAKEMERQDVVIYAYAADEDGESSFGFGADTPTGATVLELVSVDR